jgi:putative tryptophan/tyrosine transport system substrate-binding protein
MAKTFLFWLLVTFFLMTAPSVNAQQLKKVPRIGYLAAPDATTEAARVDGFRQALRELGYIEGQTIAIEYRYTEGKIERAPEIAAEFVRLKVDIIVVAGGDPWIQGTQNTTKMIPIIMTGRGSDPVKAGFVESLARPGGNVTGLTTLITELAGKRLELLKEAIPKVSRVAFLYDPASPSNLNELKEAQSTASALKLTIRPWEARAANDFDRVFTALNKDHPDGLYVAQGTLMRTNVKRITGFALKSKVPSLYTNTEAIDAGGLMYYGADLADTYRRVAYYVDKILKGAKPADLPVQQPTKFELAFNLKTAKQIGVIIPQALLYRADKVVR